MRVICLVESVLGAGVSDDAAIFKMHSKCCKIYSEHMRTAAGMVVAGGETSSAEKTNADRLAMNAVKKYLVGKKNRAATTATATAAVRVDQPAKDSATDQDDTFDIDLFITKQLHAHKAARISMKP